MRMKKCCDKELVVNSKEAAELVKLKTKLLKVEAKCNKIALVLRNVVKALRL